MSQRVHLVNEASAELEDAARWYEQRHAGLGLAFVAASIVPSSRSCDGPKPGCRLTGWLRIWT